MPTGPDATAPAPRSPGAVVRHLIAAFRARSFATDGAWVVATQVVGKGSATLLTLLLARFLSVAQFSSFTYLFTTATLLSSYLAAGLPLAISRVVAEGRDARSWPGDDRLGAVVLVTVASSLAALALAPLYLPWLLSDEIPLSGGWVLATALAITWSALAQAGLYGSGQFRAAFAGVVAGTGFLLVFTGLALGLRSMTLLIACNVVAILIPAANCTRHLIRGGVLSRPHWTRWPGRAAVAEVLATTLPGLGFSVIYASINWLLARTLIERQQGVDQFNQYAIGLQWFSLVLFVPLAFGQVLFPRFVQKARNRSLGLAEIVLPPAFTFALVLVCALAGAALAPLVSWAYGGRYAFTGAFVFTVLLAAALSGAVNLLGSFVMAARGFGAWLAINVASAAGAAGLLWMLPVDTAIGAARVLCLIQLTPIVLALMLVVHHRRQHPLAHGSREEVVVVPAATPLNDGR